MNLEDLSAACPGVDFSIPYKPYDTSYSVGDYVIEFLQKTFDIIKSSPTIKNSVIVDFVKAGFTDNRLPYSKALLKPRSRKLPPRSVQILCRLFRTSRIQELGPA
jgi:hypothetical protein